MGGKARGHKRTASAIGLSASKKVCSVADSECCDRTDLSGEGDKEVFTDITDIVHASESRRDCNLCRLIGPEIAVLKTTISKQTDQIAILTNRVNFLLSAWGLSEKELSALNSEHNSDTKKDVNNGGVAGIDPTPAELAGQHINSLSSGQETASKNAGKMNYANAVRKIQSSMVAAVHVEQRRIQRRSRNFIVSGLSTVINVSDKLLVEQLIADTLNLTVNVVFCKRLGVPVHGKVQRLLISAESNEQAGAVIAAANKLRFSLNPEISKNVFISQDLTAAEQKAAYELRCQRRAVALRRKGSNGLGNQLHDPADSASTQLQSTAIAVLAPGTDGSQIQGADSAVSDSVVGLKSSSAEARYRSTNHGMSATASAFVPTLNSCSISAPLSLVAECSAQQSISSGAKQLHLGHPIGDGRPSFSNQV
jgi:hypothetical protein